MELSRRRELERAADLLRLRAVRMVAPHGFGYLGQVLSSAELMAVTFAEGFRPGVDELVVSPGHYIIVAYAAGPELGLLNDHDLATYGFDGSSLEAIGTESSPVADITGGSLGQGLSSAVGLALAAQLYGDDARRIFALVSDGELEEGQVWEAAMFAAHRGLSNLIVLLDANNSQVDGPVTSITTLEPIAKKWESFGWAAYDVDGHDVAALATAIHDAIEQSRPAIVIARTSTAQGLACLSEGADGHFIKISGDLIDAAVAELEARRA
ncbi:MAG TPA: 1-deoxy-D-xylulose-5-phosphate synthase N-terminal domain-containing protein [Acidimicrobiales bacterium]